MLVLIYFWFCWSPHVTLTTNANNTRISTVHWIDAPAMWKTHAYHACRFGTLKNVALLVSEFVRLWVSIAQHTNTRFCTHLLHMRWLYALTQRFSYVQVHMLIYMHYYTHARNEGKHTCTKFTAGLNLSQISPSWSHACSKHSG